MDEKSLLKLCLISSLIGLFILYMGAQLKEAEKMKIGEIGKSDVGKVVTVEGTISSKYYNGKHMFFDLKDNSGEIEIVAFEDSINRNNINPKKIKEGDKISVTGKINLYKGKLEIIAERFTGI